MGRVLEHIKVHPRRLAGWGCTHGGDLPEGPRVPGKVTSTVSQACAGHCIHEFLGHKGIQYCIWSGAPRASRGSNPTLLPPKPGRVRTSHHKGLQADTVGPSLPWALSSSAWGERPRSSVCQGPLPAALLHQGHAQVSPDPRKEGCLSSSLCMAHQSQKPRTAQWQKETFNNWEKGALQMGEGKVCCLLGTAWRAESGSPEKLCLLTGCEEGNGQHWPPLQAQQNFQRFPHSLQTTNVVMGSSELRVCTCV